MRDLPQLPDSYFKKFKNKPVKIKPFNLQAKKIADQYITELKKLLVNFAVKYRIRGSTAFGIAGKGDIEIGIYPKEKDWNSVLKSLKDHFGRIDNLERNYARFNDSVNDFEVEVILMKGQDAEVDKKLHDYLMSHPNLLKEYEQIKRKHAHSKKEYMIEKDKFLRKVVEMIPD